MEVKRYERIKKGKKRKGRESWKKVVKQVGRY
jgi:hypothetical protein